jgi:two-component system, cell cycle sensor histidine kinase and response regulator CckA
MSPANPDNPSPTRPNKAVLVYVVDDEPMVGDVVQAILKMGGFESVFFAEPEAMLKALPAADPKPDLLITDYLMPRMNGCELIEQCRAAAPRLKTILYSGNAQEDAAGFYPAHPDRFLRKPFTPQVLIDLVRSLLPD